MSVDQTIAANTMRCSERMACATRVGLKVCWCTSVFSSLSVGYLLNANRSTQTVCGIDLNFSDYRIIAYVFMAIMVFGLAAAFAIDFGVLSFHSKYMHIINYQ